MIRFILVFAFLTSYVLSNAQSIIGGDEVCSNNFSDSLYVIEDTTCTINGVITWRIYDDDDNSVLFQTGIYPASPTANELEVNWWSYPDREYKVTVAYYCGGNLKKDTIDVTVIRIESPLLSSDPISLTCGEAVPFNVNAVNQLGSGFTYAWNLPECFTGSSSTNSIGITPDAAATGTICITVSHSYCYLSENDCIDIMRSCEDVITYASTAPPSFTSVDSYIYTTGNVTTSGQSYVEFRAGVGINLKPGFNADEEFWAHIAPCQCKPDGHVGCFYNEAGRSAHVEPEEDVNDDNTFSMKVNNLVSDRDEELSTISTIKASIIPNPTTGLVSIRLEKFQNDALYFLKLTNQYGKEIYSHKMIDGKSNLDLHEYESGIYFIQISDGSNIYTSKIVKN